MERQCDCGLRGEVKRPLCFRQFVPSPFCEGVRELDQSKGLLRTYFNCPTGSELDEEFYQFVGSHNVRALNLSATFDLQESINLIHQCISGLRGVRIDTYQVVNKHTQS